MRLRFVLALGAMAIAVAACSNLGLGEPDCVPPERDVSSSNILNLQAVPTARYTPCLDSLPPGWDSVNWFARDGEAGIEVLDGTKTVLTATVTPACDPGAAVKVPSGLTDVERFENITAESVAVRITIVPTGQRPLDHASTLIIRLGNVDLDDRPVVFHIDENISGSSSARVEAALEAGHYVWIIDELDAEEGRLELRSNHRRVRGPGLRPDEALDRIDDNLPPLFYRGQWFFTFAGGCITYDFDADGPIAETIAADAQRAIGLYPAHRLRKIAEDGGFQLTTDD